MKDNYITLTMVSDGHTKTFAIPRGRLEIEDIKKAGVTTLSGEEVLSDITDYYKFIITADNGYSETENENAIDLERKKEFDQAMQNRKATNLKVRIKKLRMTNQASQDELDNILDNIFWLGYKFAIDKLDKTPNEYLAETIEAIAAIIRTEKLKLLSEVRERVVGEDETRIPADGGPFTNTTDKPNHYITLRNANRADQRAALTKLEAEL